MGTLKIQEMSEFEREYFCQKLEEELSYLREIKDDLEECLLEANAPDNLYKQRAKTIRLEKKLKTKIKQIQVDRHLKMLTLDLCQMKTLKDSLKKRIVSKVDPKNTQLKIAAFQRRIQEEILQEEWGLKPGFKSFPITSHEVDILTKMRRLN